MRSVFCFSLGAVFLNHQTGLLRIYLPTFNNQYTAMPVKDIYPPTLNMEETRLARWHILCKLVFAQGPKRFPLLQTSQLER